MKDVQRLPLERRRFLQIAAFAATAAAFPAVAASLRIPCHVRKGELLGAETEIRLFHPDARAANAAIDQCFAEARRLESIFSLQRPDSALSRLNRAGRLDHPPQELVALLERAMYFSRATDGAFDATVQPLWELYLHHFSAPIVNREGPSPSDIARARAFVDYRAVQASERRIAFQRPGMAITLNGVAQGYITDRVSDLLRRRGFQRVLVNMGETRALGAHPDGSPWRVAIADPGKPWHSVLTLALEDCALATSGGYGTVFDASGRFHHLFDPHTGKSAQHYRSVSVVAPDATTADGLSTGLCVLAPAAAQRAIDACPEVGALFVRPDGTQWRAGVPIPGAG
jgi:thiamine biosynthesis lipoprotein